MYVISDFNETLTQSERSSVFIIFQLLVIFWKFPYMAIDKHGLEDLQRVV